MTREELIEHLEHLEKYTHYSEDAPALREVIEMLKCSEMPNSSKDFFWKNARKNARKYTETHACDLIERETARRIIGSPRSKEQMLRMLEATPPAQPDHSADVSKMVNGDVVSRREAIDAVNSIDNLDAKARGGICFKLMGLPPAWPAPQWIPCSERLPENAKHKGAFCPKYYVMTEFGQTEGWYNPDVGCWYVLLWFMDARFENWNISLERGDVPKLVKNVPVVAWMPLPEPYKERREDG